MADTYGKQPVRTVDAGDLTAIVVQDAAANLLATVFQSNAQNLLATVHGDAGNLSATAVQSNAANLLCTATAVQSNAANLLCTATAVQANAENLLATVHGDAGNLSATVVQSNAANLLCTATAVQSNAANLLCTATAVQSNAANLLCTATAVQSNASNLLCTATAVQSNASNLLCTATAVQSNAANLKTAISDSSGTAFGATNGLYVVPTTAAVWNVNVTGGAASVASYDGQAAAGNGAAAVNHDYGPTAQAERINSIVCSSTTSASYYIGIDPAGGTTFTTKWVAFTSESQPTVVVDTSDYHLPLGATMRIVKTNTAKAATSYSIHSTINLEY